MVIDLSEVNLHPRSAGEAAVALEEVAARLRLAGDARAVFPDVYAVITRKVTDAIAGRRRERFLESGWLSRLAGRFAEQYLATVAATLGSAPPGSTAWAFAHGYSGGGLTLPWHDALLGLSAHINYDLAQGLYETIRASGTSGDPLMLERYRHDHDLINQILWESIPECIDLLVERYRCRVSRALSRVPLARLAVHRLVMGLLERWRARVWQDLLEMLRGDDTTRRRVRQRMDQQAGRFASVLMSAPAAYGRLRGHPLPALSA